MLSGPYREILVTTPQPCVAKPDPEDVSVPTHMVKVSPRCPLRHRCLCRNQVRPLEGLANQGRVSD